MLSKNLKKLRTENKKTQKQVAEFLNITREAYTQYETGVRRPDYEIILKLADFFDVSVDFLLGRTNVIPHTLMKIFLPQISLRKISQFMI